MNYHREPGFFQLSKMNVESLSVSLSLSDLMSFPDHPESSRSVPECTAVAETVMEVRLRDLLLDIEDRIHQGTLGTLKVHTHFYLQVRHRCCR